MASVQRWPKSGLDTLKQGLARERSADLAANEAALKMLCIRAEMLADMPTPPEGVTVLNAVYEEDFLGFSYGFLRQKRCTS